MPDRFWRFGQARLSAAETQTHAGTTPNVRSGYRESRSRPDPSPAAGVAAHVVRLQVSPKGVAIACEPRNNRQNDRPMRVLYVIDSLAAGGAETSLAALAPHLIAGGSISKSRTSSSGRACMTGSSPPVHA